MFNEKLEALQLAHLDCLRYLNNIKEVLKLDGPVVRLCNGKIGYLSIDTDTNSPFVYRIEYSNMDAKGYISTKPVWSLNVNGMTDEEIFKKLRDNFKEATEDDIKFFKKIGKRY